MCRKIIDPREDSLKLLSKYVYLKENMYIQKKIEKKDETFNLNQRSLFIVKRREITDTWLIRVLRIQDSRVLSFKQDLCSSPSKAQRTLHKGQEESNRQKTGRNLSNVIWTQCSLGIGQSLPSFKQSLVEGSKRSLKDCHG